MGVLTFFWTLSCWAVASVVNSVWRAPFSTASTWTAGLLQDTQSVTTLTVVFAFNSSVLLRRDLRLSRLIFSYSTIYLTIIWNFDAWKLLLGFQNSNLVFFPKKNPKPWCTTCCAASVLWHYTISSDKLQHCWSAIAIRVIALQLSHIVNKNKTMLCTICREKSKMYLKTTCFDFKQLQKLDVITDTTVQQEVTYLHIWNIRLIKLNQV